MVYKWCVVPQCINTSIKNPQKLFLSVPTNPKRRKKWLQLARRDPNSIQAHSNVFMCEDHFDLEKDTLNYMKYKMGFSQKILLADEAAPSKFYCQDDRKRRLCDEGSSREAFLKRQRKELVKQCEEESHVLSQNPTETLQKEDNSLLQDIINTQPEGLPRTQDKETTTNIITTTDKSVQVTTKVNVHYRSKSVQTRLPQKNVSTSPFKVFTISRYTSPFKIEPCHPKPSKSGITSSIRRNVFPIGEKSDSDISLFTETECGYSSPFAVPSSSMASDSGSNISDINENLSKLQSLKNTMLAIHKKCSLYVGIPTECYYIIHLIHKETNIKMEYILLCLKKIRMNRTFSELEDNFGISLSYASKLFLQNIPFIASVLQPFIVKLDRYLIKKISLLHLDTTIIMLVAS